MYGTQCVTGFCVQTHQLLRRRRCKQTPAAASLRMNIEVMRPNLQLPAEQLHDGALQVLGVHIPTVLDLVIPVESCVATVYRVCWQQCAVGSETHAQTDPGEWKMTPSVTRMQLHVFECLAASLNYLRGLPPPHPPQLHTRLVSNCNSAEFGALREPPHDTQRIPPYSKTGTRCHMISSRAGASKQGGACRSSRACCLPRGGGPRQPERSRRRPSSFPCPPVSLGSPQGCCRPDTWNQRRGHDLWVSFPAPWTIWEDTPTISPAELSCLQLLN